MKELLLFCRAGFEVEAGQEMVDALATLGGAGYFVPRRGAGTVRFVLADGSSPERVLKDISLDQMVFVRDWFLVLGEIQLPESDRVQPLLDWLYERQPEMVVGRVEVRLPESAERDLAVFGRKWTSPLVTALKGAGFLSDGADPDGRRLELYLESFQSLLVGVSVSGQRAPWLSGIPRLKLPGDAPSRSALKLEEAWKVFLPEANWLDYLGGGKEAVDLGAAPGGWTWQLVRQGMNVTAVDNGPMDERLMATGQVEHVLADGFTWRPRRGVDWMVCDIVDKPRRTASMVAEWVIEGLCRYTIFNLKLPMKQRYEEWGACLELLESRFEQAGVEVRIRAKQLYHDREEITCFVERLTG